MKNPKKFKKQKKECHTFKYIKLLFANIGFCNYSYLDGYDYKVISKLPNEINDREYLDKFYKMDIEEIKNLLGMDKNDSDEIKENNNISEEKSQDETMHSEIYGVSKGHVYEKSTPTKNTTSQVESKKFESKKSSATSTKISDTRKKKIKGSNVGNKYYNKGKTSKK